MVESKNNGSQLALDAVLSYLREFKAKEPSNIFGLAESQPNELWETIDSTNTRASTLLKEGAPAGVVVMARQQTAGRGRLGRTWVSPPDAGIYTSITLRPKVGYEKLPLYTLAAGVAAASAICNSTGLVVGLKWVNDLIVNDRKLGGILAELSQPVSVVANERNPSLVVGIGINIQLAPDTIPDELKDKVEWLERACECEIDVNKLMAYLIVEFERLCHLIETNESASILDRWRTHSITLGQTIRASVGNSIVEGQALDITDSGSLIVLTTSGEKVQLHAGEVTIRAANGNYV